MNDSGSFWRGAAMVFLGGVAAIGLAALVGKAMKATVEEIEGPPSPPEPKPAVPQPAKKLK
jgi:hypothetical protein